MLQRFIKRKMHEIKYQPLKNNDGEPVVEYSNYSYQTRLYQECNIHWVLKLLFVCFVIFKVIYVINNYEYIKRWIKNYNQTDILNENVTYLYGEESMITIRNDLGKAIDKDSAISVATHDGNASLLSQNIFENKKDIILTTSLVNDDNVHIFKGVHVTTAVTDNYRVTTEIYLGREGIKEEHTTKTNDYRNANLTTTKLAVDREDDTKTTMLTEVYLNYSTALLTTTRKTPTTIAIYLNKTATENVTTTAITSKATPISPKLKTSSVQQYFINTSRCHIPFVDPLSPKIRKIFKPQHYTGCTKDQPIVRVLFNDSNARYILHINYTVAEQFRTTTNNTVFIEEDVLCCYQEIIRSGSGANADTSFKLLPCTNFHQDFVVPLHINGIIVKCKSKFKNDTLQEDAFSFIQVNETLIQEELSRNIINARRKPSIFMIGIDTLSRINFRRNMPQLFKYLLDNKWYELMGYNKVGDNTLPNLMPLLSGYTKTTVYNKCKPKKIGGFDNCNFIWSTLKKYGYHTAYAEDLTSITTFNYHLKGFQQPPTDYYFHPIALAIEKTMKRKTKAGLNFCVGRKQYGEYIYDFGTEFAKRYQNLSSFGFFWTNSFSHNSYDVSATMDHTMVNYFKEWEREGIFENSVVMFFSDHGARWGPLLKLPEGFLEERLPMFFISIPKWFRQEYPDLVKNLETNQQRLVAPFDIHMTLKHLLKLGEPKYEVEQAFDCPKCQSIFEELPENRTCDDASIPKTWCTCLPFKTVSMNSDEIRLITKLIIQEINHYYEVKNITSLCSPLKLNKITDARKRYPDELSSSNNLTTYLIDFITEPLTDPKAKFSATVDYDEHNKLIHLNVEDISRQSLYENTAKCMNDKQAKKYCICKNSLKSPT